MFAASLIAAWTWGRTLRAVDDALGRLDGGVVAVVGGAPLAKLLAKSRQVISVVPGGELPAGDGGLAGIVGLRGASEARLAVWSQAVRDGGVLVLLERAPPEAMTKLALCAGLVDVEQRVAGRWIVTSGRVKRI
jgi:hypothetical protein